MTREELLQRFPRMSEACIRRTLGAGEAGGVAKVAERELHLDVEPVAAAAGAVADAVRRRVRVTSFRRVLCDERNLHEKAFIDSCKYAGAIYDDAPKWCKVEVEQVKVMREEEERTEIVIEDMNE